ncbi:TonB-dependent receptor plug domain-containing protein [Opitutus sp. ER46]|uniref:TonB-dependent receptor plug domain-containing protein n=1 Tax=Opitutus sp. ER46 TaxID=2161864 RepID=UPI000D31E70A|nr:TonB-dependent receptor plug domain-containing protein [Opitutus sp. ER46]PTX92466.1 hypothetical protein DB354_14115 [Opitutus sp. ER46]
MNPNRWLPPVNPALIVALAGLAIATSPARAQTAPGVDAATLAKYDTNHNGVLDTDEQAAMRAAQAAPAASTTAAKPEAGAGDIIELSPFQVDASRDKGYFAENTLAGSRMNTNISDLGASISVITKQQLEDTASVDINDVFRYELNTEGSSTYTPAVASQKSDGMLDTIAGGTNGGTVASSTNATANRIRGIGTPSRAINYYPSISQVPMDAYNVQSVEISRGPNSMLFGMGSPAGIVNQTNAQALLNRNTNRVDVRADQNGSYRASLSFNRSLIQDKLAVYGALLYDDRQFERKPSYDRTRRQYGALTFKPFERTILRASVEGYNNDNRRPNSITPRDFVTEWKTAGQPVWDSLNKKITKLSTGEVVGPYVSNSLSPRAAEVIAYIKSRSDFDAAKWNASKNTYNGVSIFGSGAMTNTSSILYVPGVGYPNAARSIMQIYGGQLMNWFSSPYNTTYRTAWGTSTNPAASATAIPSSGSASSQVWSSTLNADVWDRAFVQSNGWSFNPNAAIIGGNKYAGVSDQSVYDWTDINISQANYGRERNTNLNLELEQEITKNLFLTAGWMREDFDAVSNYTVAQQYTSTLYIDNNKYMPDGSANPGYLMPYVMDFEPDRYTNAQLNDHFRAMLAYTPDFTRNSGWTKWLGRHQILGLWSRDEYMATNYRQRVSYVDAATAAGKYRFLNNQNKNADGTETGWSYQGTGVQRFYYLGTQGATNGAVTRSSGEWNAEKYNGNVRVFNYDTGQFEDVNVTTDHFTRSEGTGRNQRLLNTVSAATTNYLWNDRLVTTFGYRKDVLKLRNTTTAAIKQPDGSTMPTMTNPQMWVNGQYNTDVIFNRWENWTRLNGYTSTAGGVLRPFRGWDSIENRANSGSLFWQFVRDLGFSYNTSDNFNAPDGAYVDAFGTPLPKPTGNGKDYGFQFALFDNKLFARVSWFEASNQNELAPGKTALDRLVINMDQTLFRGWARTIAMINLGMDPTSDTFFSQTLDQSVENQVQDAAEKIWQQDYLYYDGKSIRATQDAEAKGMEISLNYNPSRNWTMRATFSKQDTKYSNVQKQYDAWYAQRGTIWQKAKAADYLLPQYQQYKTFTRANGELVDLTNFWTSYGFNANVLASATNGQTNVQNYYNVVVMPQYALNRDLNGQSSPGQRKYRWSYLTNYTFDSGKLKGWGVGGAERWEDKSIIGYYGKASGAIAATPNLLDISDTTRPIYDDAQFYTDLWVSYRTKIFNDRVRMKVQLNVSNVFESGELRVVRVNLDGSPYGYRIIDPRQFNLTASFEF